MNREELIACPECGLVMTPFNGETLNLCFKGESIPLDGLSGWVCQGCEERVFHPDSALRWAAAGDRLLIQDRQRLSQKFSSEVP
jgi:HTH-type transcriptional regulator/antitoxin MqsA